jgi:integrase
MPAGGYLKEVRAGVWRSKVLVGYRDGDTTRPIQHTETYGTNTAPIGSRAAAKFHADHVTRAGSGAVSTSTGTFGSYLSSWLDQRAGTWKATTARRNRSIVAKLPGSLTSVKLSQLRRGDVQAYVDTLPAAGARRVHAVLQSALQDAVDGQKVGLAANPAKGIRLPRKSVAEATPPTDEELQLVLGAAGLKGELWRDLFTFAAFTGLRRGEVCALRWDDIEDDVVNVRYSVETLTKSKDGSTWSLTDTKTHQARRVPLAASARRAVQRRADNELLDGSTFVFSEDGGATPVHPDRMSKVFAAAADRAGVQCTLKDLRSYAATVLAESAGLKVAQAFLGHRDVTTTARHYASARQSAMVAGVAALDRLDHEQPAVSA